MNTNTDQNRSNATSARNVVAAIVTGAAAASPLVNETVADCLTFEGGVSIFSAVLWAASIGALAALLVGIDLPSPFSVAFGGFIGAWMAAFVPPVPEIVSVPLGCVLGAVSCIFGIYYGKRSRYLSTVCVFVPVVISLVTVAVLVFTTGSDVSPFAVAHFCLVIGSIGAVLGAIAGARMPREMIREELTPTRQPENREKAIVGLAVGVLLQLVGLIVFQTGDTVGILGGVVFGLAGISVFSWWCMSYAESKRYSKWVGLIGLASLIGLIILFLLPDPPKTKHRWYRLTLRGILTIAMLMVLVAFGVWVQFRLQQAHENRQRVATIDHVRAEIKKLGGRTWSDSESRPMTRLERLFQDPGGPDDPVVVFVWHVSLAGTQVTDADLEPLKGLTNQRSLYLDDTDITDAGMEHLKGFTALRSLHLDDTDFSDAGLEYLKGLTNLERLDLSSTWVTDAGLEHLKGLTNLEYLDLEYPYSKKVTDAGLEHLKDLTSLEYLNLGCTHVTDAGLAHMKELKKLEQLYLDQTNITDSGLEHLKRLANLKYLRLTSTNVTEEGVKNLQQALPKCEIDR